MRLTTTHMAQHGPLLFIQTVESSPWEIIVGTSTSRQPSHKTYWDFGLGTEQTHHVSRSARTAVGF